MPDAASSAVKPHRVFAALYDRQLRSLEHGWLGQRRAELVSELPGRVLEVGAGTGANLPHYRRADRLIACEPDSAMRARLVRKLAAARIPVEVCDAPVEDLPDDTGSVDAVVCMLVLCTVPDPVAALAQVHRVLRPGGRLVLLEHVRAAGRLAGWQDRLAPLQVRLAAGCHPNRDTLRALSAAGFEVQELDIFEPSPNSPLTRPFIAATAIRGADA